MEHQSAEAFKERYEATLARIRLNKLVRVELSTIGQDGVVALHSIVSADKGKGHAKCAMRALMSMADDLEFDVVTVPRALDEATDLARLVAWFKRIGFEVDASGKTMRRKVMWSRDYGK